MSAFSNAYIVGVGIGDDPLLGAGFVDAAKRSVKLVAPLVAEDDAALRGND